MGSRRKERPAMEYSEQAKETWRVKGSGESFTLRGEKKWGEQ